MRGVWRPNYDKAHRCPVATGPGWEPMPDDVGCRNGYVVFRWNGWGPGRCRECWVVVLPYRVTRVWWRIGERVRLATRPTS